MKLGINIALGVLAVVLTYLLVQGIKEPIEFKDFKEKRESIVRAHLEDIAKAQEAYRAITGQFAPTFDTLEQVLNSGSFTVTAIKGNADDSNAVVTTVDMKIPAKDSVLRMFKQCKTIEELRFLPFTDNSKLQTPESKQFTLNADTISQMGVTVWVFESATRVGNYMSDKYDDKKYATYDSRYDHNATRKVGDMTTPKITGNWSISRW